MDHMRRIKASERVSISLCVGLFLFGGARADLLLESPFDFNVQPLGRASSDYVCSDLEAQVTDTPGLACPLRVPEFNPLYLFPGDGNDLAPPPLVPPVQIVADSGSSSVSLCLSALMSVGLFSSIHSARKLSFGFIPQWYHNGGPFQVGHSMAVCPNSVCSVPVCCFVQPILGVADIALQRHFGAVASLWRTSQFTPDLLAARGPPAFSQAGRS